MPIIPAPNEQWYVIQVLSGHEGKVKRNMMYRIEKEELGDLIFEVLVPMERVSEVKKGKKMEMNRKFFPGYIIANMHLLDNDNRLIERAWYFIQETDGVIGFAGNREKPVPMRPKEVESMLAQIREREDSIAPKIAFAVGETVKVADGPFDGQIGTIQEINAERGELIVAVDIFGRSQPVPLEYWQIEKTDDE